MKTLSIVITLTLSLLFTVDINAQKTPMTKGDQVVFLGIGVGGYGSGFTRSNSPAIIGTFQQGIKNDLGPGNLSVGGTIAFKTGQFDGFSRDASYSYFALAGRASYHPHFVNSDKFDFYGGLGLGYYSVSSSLAYDDFNFGASASAMALTAHVGGRYEFSEKWSAWAELGNELSILSLGAAMKL